MAYRFSLMATLLFVCFTAFASKDIAITFNSGGYNLFGTLTVPDGTGPFPVAILVHGSGPNDRDETAVFSGGNYQCLFPGLYNKTLTPFKDLAERLSKNGFAVFRYDKRSYTYASSIDPKKISVYDFVKDISAAVDAMKARSEVDPKKIILIGHSEGCNFIPIVARQRSDIYALIALASPGRGIDTILADQVRYIYRHCADSADGEAQASQFLSIFGQVRDGSWDPNTAILGTYPSYWKEWIGVTDSAVIAYNLISQPVLFLQGTSDYNVTLIDLDRFRKGISRSNVSEYVMDTLNHYMTTMHNPVVASQVTDTILYWLRKNVTGLPPIGYLSIIRPYSIITNSGGNIEIVAKDNNAIYSVQVLDASGKIKENITAQNEKINISTTAFSEGIYFIRINSKQGVFGEKLFK